KLRLNCPLKCPDYVPVRPTLGSFWIPGRMANRKKPARIEPSFDAFGADEPKSGFFVSEEDRVVPTQRRSKSGSSKGSSRREPAGTARKGGHGRKKRRGFFGFLKTAAYWSMVLCLWAGIAGIGLVAYIGAKMPAATT